MYASPTEPPRLSIKLSCTIGYHIPSFHAREKDLQLHKASRQMCHNKTAWRFLDLIALSRFLDQYTHSLEGDGPRSIIFFSYCLVLVPTMSVLFVLSFAKRIT